MHEKDVIVCFVSYRIAVVAPPNKSARAWHLTTTRKWIFPNLIVMPELLCWESNLRHEDSPKLADFVFLLFVFLSNCIVSRYGTPTQTWLICMVNVGKHIIIIGSCILFWNFMASGDAVL